MQVKVVKLVKGPVDKVFRFLADAENAPRWSRAVKSATRIEGTTWGLGSRVQYHARVMGFDFEYVTEAVEFQLNQRFLDKMIRKIRGPLKQYELEGTFRGLEGTTEVTMIIRGKLGFPPVINQVMELLFKLGLKRRLSRALETLEIT